MDRSASLQLNPILEKLRSDHQRMEHLTDSFLVGLEDLGVENARLSRQLAKKDDKIALMINETNVYHMASIEAQGNFDGVLRVNNKLRAELEKFKNLNARLGQQYDEVRDSVIKLSMQLGAADNEINHLNFRVQEAQYELNGLKIQVKKLHQIPADATLDCTPLVWPLFAGTPINGDALPTPPLVSQGISEQPHTPNGSYASRVRSVGPESKRPAPVAISSNEALTFNPPSVPQTRASARPSTKYQDAATLKPKANGITRGGSLVDESFARIKSNLALTNKTNNSDPDRVSYAPTDLGVSDSLRDFPWPQASLIQNVKKTLDPECVPFVPPAAKSRPVSKLSPFSQEFVPAMSQSQRPVTPLHKRMPKAHPRSEDSNSANDRNEAVTILNIISRPASSEPEITSSQEPEPVHTTTSTGGSPEAAAVESSSKPQGSPNDPSKTEDASSKVIDDVTRAKGAKSIPPHLRGLPPKADASKVLPVALLITPSTPVTADAVVKDTNITQPEAENMEAWLDTLEKQSTGQSVPDERSNSPPTSFGDTLIDLDIEDAGKSQEVPFNVQNFQGACMGEDYTTATSGDPYVMHVSRETTDTTLVAHTAKIKEEQSKAGTSTDQLIVSEGEAGTTGASKDDFPNTEEVGKLVSDFKTQLPATKNESNITADFLAAYGSKLLGVKSKYRESAKSEKDSSEEPPIEERYHKDQYLDPNYVAPNIVGTRVLGELLDLRTRFMIMNETPNGRGRNVEVALDWKPVIREGKTVFVL